MADPVNLADVLNRSIRQLVDNRGHVYDITAAELIVEDALAYGGGDPVVVMPDGTLRRLGNAPEELGKPGMYYLSDPVVPE